MAQIEFILEKQLLVIQNQEIISSGDMDYDMCSFTFDSTWEGFTKTGVFYQDKNNVQYAVLDADGSCTIPAQAMAKEGNLYIGVFGIDGSKVMTSTVERIYIRQGAISGDTVNTEPSDDIFLAIISQYQRIAEMMQGYEATAAELSGMLRDLNVYDVSEVLAKLDDVGARLTSVEERIETGFGGLRFGVDADGNWGYIVPESEDVIAFGHGSEEEPGEALETYQWQAVECDQGFVQDDRSWSANVRSFSSNKGHLFLAVKVPEACKSIVNLVIGDSVALALYLNDELIRENTGGSYHDGREVLQLVKGNNYIFLECWAIGGYSTDILRIYFAPIVA